MTCHCDAAYSDPDDCPRCGAQWFARLRELALPGFERPNDARALPDGPDELLAEIAEMEKYSSG